MKRAILLVGHGSRLAEANAALSGLSDLVQKTSKRDEIVVHAYLQFAKPDPASVLELLAAQDVASVVVVPVFLYEGSHFREDIPELLEQARRLYPGMKFFLAPVLGVDARLAEIVWDRVGSALREH